MTASKSCRPHFVAASVLIFSLCNMAAAAGWAAAANSSEPLALTPPMGWNDWAHYQCGFTGQTILSNAKALVATGLAARGYNTVTIDDCWMRKTRDANGTLQPDPERFPDGMKPVADAIHEMGLKFGIYEDSGSQTCGKFAGSGRPQGGGEDFFAADARLFASWGVDYLKLDGCNVFVPAGGDQVAAYREAYATEAKALKSTGRPIVFSESAPAYFEFTPEWYDVLAWVPDYGQLWREGDDMANFHAQNPDRPRFGSVLWNYAYNLPLGRFQKPGSWNDADFIIAGDGGMSVAESRSQMALWSMMSAPLILSSDISKLSPEALAILENKAVIAIDQDALGKDATLVRRSNAVDILFKPLSGGDYAVAALNRGDSQIEIEIHPAELGFAAACKLDVQNLWSGETQSAEVLREQVQSHDTAIWRLHPASSCGKPARRGAILITSARGHRSIDGYARCLSSTAAAEECDGTAAESWTISARGEWQSQQRCLALVDGKPAMQACNGRTAQRWSYTQTGNLINADDKECLSADNGIGTESALSIEPCGHNLLSQIWSLPN